VLLHGPCGTHKRSIVRTAGHQLGCHVREVRTRTLLRPTDVATTAAFRAAFESALANAPCVIHLVRACV
jgi:SpoVK/Ycf46/Vps4 family AAA+-type ATPase